MTLHIRKEISGYISFHLQCLTISDMLELSHIVTLLPTILNDIFFHQYKQIISVDKNNLGFYSEKLKIIIMDEWEIDQIF